MFPEQSKGTERHVSELVQSLYPPCSGGFVECPLGRVEGGRIPGYTQESSGREERERKTGTSSGTTWYYGSFWYISEVHFAKKL